MAPSPHVRRARRPEEDVGGLVVARPVPDGVSGTRWSPSRPAFARADPCGWRSSRPARGSREPSTLPPEPRGTGSPARAARSGWVGPGWSDPLEELQILREVAPLVVAPPDHRERERLRVAALAPRVDHVVERADVLLEARAQVEHVARGERRRRCVALGEDDLVERVREARVPRNRSRRWRTPATPSSLSCRTSQSAGSRRPARTCTRPTRCG